MHPRIQPSYIIYDTIPNKTKLDHSKNELHLAAKRIFKEHKILLLEFEQYQTDYANSLNLPKKTINVDILKEFSCLFQNFIQAKFIPEEDVLRIKKEKLGYDLGSIQFLNEGFELFKSIIKVSKKCFAAAYIDNPYKRNSKKNSLALKASTAFDRFKEKTGINYFSTESDDQLTMELIKEVNKTLNLILELAARNNCDPSIISQAQIDAFELESKEREAALQLKLKEDEAKLAWEALYNSARTKSTKSKTRASKSSKKKKKCVSKKEAKVQTPLTISTTELPKPIKKNETKLLEFNSFDGIVIKIYKHKSRFRDLKRVTKRWNTKTVSLLREIADCNAQGDLIKKYENLSESKLLKQRARHYLPGLDKIISSQFKEIYVNSVLGGFKMNALMNYGNGEVEYGTVEFGIENNLVYHRYFQPYSNSNNTGMFSFEPPDISRDSLEESEDEKWEEVSLTNFRISSDGTMTVSFNNEEHFICIYPIRSHLLDAYKIH